MANKLLSNKRVQIDKANAMMVVVTAVSSFIIVFSLVASRALLSQRAYQSRVINKKEQARDQLKTNLDNIKKLETAYTSFVGTSQNIIGGSSTGQGGKDGDNGRIVLDALPSKYDFPAVTSSLEKILTQNGLSIVNMTGSDDEVAQQSNASINNPQPIPIPFEVTVGGSYGSIQNAITVFEASIRPISINGIKFSGTDAKLNADIKAQTYYQPETSLNITTQVIK